jgi:hypothetical protein
VEVPDVQYAKSGDVDIAYQATGEGPFDLRDSSATATAASCSVEPRPAAGAPPLTSRVD